jgi:hypothetical protein
VCAVSADRQLPLEEKLEAYKMCSIDIEVVRTAGMNLMSAVRGCPAVYPIQRYRYDRGALLAYQKLYPDCQFVSAFNSADQNLKASLKVALHQVEKLASDKALAKLSELGHVRRHHVSSSTILEAQHHAISDIFVDGRNSEDGAIMCLPDHLKTLFFVIE